ncbi:hypothetical protein BJY24_005026 [Nocardia transvalensis]|uniref:STAS domain-containing protein n=1 Tax=Nocardia transvalensis TaxID=37333 RepID=A0A7W9UK57_9NOCA|nr:STAS domain-containing protein [Nocardia transvalensis]MBB5916114.1 hypothetical protein [Nocardia transvalensis]
MGGVGITWIRSEFENCSVVRPCGELDVLTYRRLSDDLVKYAVEQPRAVIVSLVDLTVTADTLMTAFSSAWMRIGTWPAVPMVLVTSSSALRDRLRSSSVDRFVPVFPTIAEAVAGLAGQPARRRVFIDLARSPACARRARRFAYETCERWSVPEVCGHAGLIATELVENSLLHADRGDDIGLRLELRGGVLTVAVYDADPHEAVLRESASGVHQAGGLHIVSRFAQAWGCSPRWPAGKVVWATLRTGSRAG